MSGALSVALWITLVARFVEHGCLKLVESGCLRQTPRIAVPLLATAHRRAWRGLVGHRSLPLLAACARPLASTSGKCFQKAGTVYARRVGRAFRPSVEMGACHRDCAHHIRADDPLA